METSPYRQNDANLDPDDGAAADYKLYGASGDDYKYHGYGAGGD